MLATKFRRVVTLGLAALVVAGLGITPAPTAHALGSGRGGFSCSPQEAGRKVCVLAFADVITGEPGDPNEVSIEFQCIVVAVGVDPVAAHVLPADKDGCQLKQEQDSVSPDPANWTLIEEAPGVGEPKATAETALVADDPDTGDPFVPTDGDWGMCWKGGAVFLDGRHLSTEACGSAAIDGPRIMEFLRATTGP